MSLIAILTGIFRRFIIFTVIILIHEVGHFVTGLILVIDSFTKMQSASGLKRYNYDKWWCILLAGLICVH